MSPRRFATITWLALIALGIIIVTGAAVRLTNSGLGCADWPKCSTTKLIDVSSRHAAIEQINRFFTGVVGVAVIVAVAASWFRSPRRRDLIGWSMGLVIGVLANAVLGGISVKVDLHPMAIQGHMLLSMALIVGATVLVRRARQPDGVDLVPAVDVPTAWMVRAHFGLSWAIVITGTVVTGTGPHAGDASARRLGFDISTVARVHSITVWATLAVAVAIMVRIRHSDRQRRALMPAVTLWLTIGILQSAVGYIQYFSGVPALLVEAHVLGATLAMWASTNLLLDTSSPAPVGSGGDLDCARETARA